MAGKVISFTQQKGGAGKTTLAAHTAIKLQQLGKTVVMVDVDPQGSLTQWDKQRVESLGAEAAVPKVYPLKGWRLSSEVNRLKQEYDIVVVDSPPHADTDARIAMRVADLAVVPMQPSPADLWATQPTLGLARSEGVTAIVVLNRVPSRSSLTDTILQRLREQEIDVATTMIGNRVGFAAALDSGKGISETASTSSGALEIEALAVELLTRLGIQVSKKKLSAAAA